jgi:hypothetical protein
LHLKLDEDDKNCEILVTAGGCFVLIHLMNNYLDKAIAGIPACDQVTEWNTHAELITLVDTLCVIGRLTCRYDASRVGISAIGGVEAVLKILKTFPKFKALQSAACVLLGNLACCSIGKAKATELGGIEAGLAAVSNHLACAQLCRHACWLLRNIVSGSKENTKLLISLGGGAAVDKVSTQWPDNKDVRTQVRQLEYSFVAEWKARADKE